MTAKQWNYWWKQTDEPYEAEDIVARIKQVRTVFFPVSLAQTRLWFTTAAIHQPSGSVEHGARKSTFSHALACVCGRQLPA